MKTSETVSEIFKAHIALQSELGNIAKDSSGYGYKYTSLDKLIAYTKPYLAKYNLGYIQTNTTLSDGSIGVTTRLIHISGEWVEDTLSAQLYKLAKMNEYQVAGSLVTYFRRYGLASILGIASDDDMDATGEVQKPKLEPEITGYKTASKATPEDKKAYWDEMKDYCQLEDVDPIAFLENDIDLTDKNLTHNTVIHWLREPELLKTQLINYKQGNI